MRRWLWIILAAVAATVAASLFGGEHAKCSAPFEECAKKIATKHAQMGWLGVDLEKHESGHLMVTRVYPGSPAEKAGFQAGDVLLSVNGVDYTKENKEALVKAKEALVPGAEATYLFTRKGEKAKVVLKLGTMPHELLAQSIGEHFLESHVQTTAVAK